MSGTSARRIAALFLAVASLCATASPAPARAVGCVLPQASQAGNSSVADAREQIGPMLAHVEQTQADVRGDHPLAARVDFERFAERWDEVDSVVGQVLPERCAAIEAQLVRLDDALLGRVADEDLAASDDALSHLRWELHHLENELAVDGATATAALNGKAVGG